MDRKIDQASIESLQAFQTDFNTIPSEIERQVLSHLAQFDNNVKGEVLFQVQKQWAERDNLLELFVPQGELANVRLELCQLRDEYHQREDIHATTINQLHQKINFLQDRLVQTDAQLQIAQVSRVELSHSDTTSGPDSSIAIDQLKSLLEIALVKIGQLENQVSTHTINFENNKADTERQLNDMYIMVTDETYL